jgi:hypothetical protein
LRSKDKTDELAVVPRRVDELPVSQWRLELDGDNHTRSLSTTRVHNVDMWRY